MQLCLFKQLNQAVPVHVHTLYIRRLSQAALQMQETVGTASLLKLCRRLTCTERLQAAVAGCEEVTSRRRPIKRGCPRAACEQKDRPMRAQRAADGEQRRVPSGSLERKETKKERRWTAEATAPKEHLSTTYLLVARPLGVRGTCHQRQGFS